MTEKEMLDKLLTYFYISQSYGKGKDHLFFSFREDFYIGDEDSELEKNLMKYIKDNNIESI